MWISIARHQWKLRSVVAFLLAFAVIPEVLHAQPPDVDPTAPDVRQWQEYGRMFGACEQSNPGDGESFGRSITAVGDVDFDGLADWLVRHYRCNVIGPKGGTGFAPEVLLYRGVPNGIPAVNSGVSIGPTDAAWTEILTVGDFDGDENRDLVLTTQMFGPNGFWPAEIIVFWGNATGNYTLQDTSRIYGAAQHWLHMSAIGVEDFSGDGIDDLVVTPGRGFQNGGIVEQARMMIFTGGPRERWGRAGKGRTADWQWWNMPKATNLEIIDQDCDQIPDVLLIGNNTGPSVVTVLYGRNGSFPDTLEHETIDLAVAGGRMSLMSDVTGDKSPELIVHTGTQEVVRVYAGRPGQRLQAQYGSGNDGPVAGNGWWRRPWAEVWLPARLNAGWDSTAREPLYNIGDITGDGISEIWASSDSLVISYFGGPYLDSLIDATLTIPYGIVQAVANLGDIDGSGVRTIAIGFNQPFDTLNPLPGGILFLKPLDGITPGGTLRPVPHLPGESCGSISAIPPTNRVDQQSVLNVEADPRQHQIRLRWSGRAARGNATVTISDSRGAELLRVDAEVSDHRLVIPDIDLPPGPLFIQLIVGDHVLRASTVW